jgi:cytoskeletal protein CcmA (bactofilin family)
VETSSLTSSTPSAFEIHSGLVLKGQLSMEKDVVLTGKFEGELQTFGCLTVAAGGVVTGTIDAGALVLEPGNLVDARVKVGTQPKPAPRSEEKKVESAGWSGQWKKIKAFAFGKK